MPAAIWGSVSLSSVLASLGAQQKTLVVFNGWRDTNVRTAGGRGVDGPKALSLVPAARNRCCCELHSYESKSPGL